MQAVLSEQEVLSGSAARSRSRLMWAMVAAAVVLGAVQTFTNRHVMNSDGISYLDMGSGLFGGNWKAILNSVWSPMYPALLGLVQSLVKPAPYWEFTLAHVTTFFTYLLALAGFTFLVRTLTSYLELQDRTLPARSVTLIGYSLFLWASLVLIDLATVSPDLLASAFLYTAAGLLLNIRRGRDGWKTYALLGITLGFGFLAKAPMLPLGLVCLILSVPAASRRKTGLLGAVIAATLMAIVILPYGIALSQSKGRITLGDSAALNYAWHVNGVPRYHWRGEIAGNGTAAHPSRKILDTPPVYEFARAAGGTYPLWFDPSYWNEGLRPRIRLGNQLKALYSVSSEYLNLFLGLQAGVAIGIFALLFAGGSPRQVLRNIGHEWVLLGIPLIGLAMYQLVHFEARYIAAFLVLLWLGLLAAVRTEESLSSWRLIHVVPLGIAILLLTRVATYQMGPTTQEIVNALRGHGETSHIQWRVATGLVQMGTQPGDSFAIIKTRPDVYYWARLAKAHVVAELPDAGGAFWYSSRDAQTRVLKALESTGVKGVVAADTPPDPMSGWRGIGDTGYSVYFFRN
jgi:hypothetical protein